MSTAPADALVEQAFALFTAFCEFDGDPEPKEQELIRLFEVLKEYYPHRFAKKTGAAIKRIQEGGQCKP